MAGFTNHHFFGCHYVRWDQLHQQSQKKLTEQTIETMLAVTYQQQQAFDNFITADRERLNGIADFLIRNDYARPRRFSGS